MKLTLLITAIIILTQSLPAQKPAANEYAAVDKKALQLPDSLTSNTNDIATYVNANFKTEKDKARAIFIWIASNIQYDIDNMFAINFYEPREEKIAKPLKTRKGICENYAVLFTDICSKSGIKSYVIEGYTKQNGFTDYIPHAWCAAKIDSTWFMFDPTWGSGYVSNGRFYKKINNDYYKVNPLQLIKTHMPFDYLWQFLNYPVTSQEFYDGKTQPNKSKPFFNFSDSIRVYESQNTLEQLQASAARIEKNGMKNSMIFDRLQHIRLENENNIQWLPRVLVPLSLNQSLVLSFIVDFNELNVNGFLVIKGFIEFTGTLLTMILVAIHDVYILGIVMPNTRPGNPLIEHGPPGITISSE